MGTKKNAPVNLHDRQAPKRRSGWEAWRRKRRQAAADSLKGIWSWMTPAQAKEILKNYDY